MTELPEQIPPPPDADAGRRNAMKAMAGFTAGASIYAGFAASSARGGTGSFPFESHAARPVVVTDFPSVAAALATMPNGGDLFFPASGSPYQMSATVVDRPGVRFIGEGAGDERPLLKWNSLGASVQGLNVTAPGFSLFNLRLEGPAGGVYVPGENLVHVQGNSAASPFQGLHIENCEFRNVGARGLHAQFVNYIRVVGCRFEDIGNAGAMFLSCDWGWFENNTVQCIKPGTTPNPDTTNAYGVSLTHESTGWPGAESQHPFCRNWWITGNYIDDIPWEGIDGHGGWNVHISDNIVRNTKLGISSAQSSGDASAYAGGPCWVTGNYVHCEFASPNKLRGYGVNVSGGTTRWSLGAYVYNNYFFLKGRAPSGGFPVIYIGSCIDTRVENNYFDEIGDNAIALRAATGRVRITGNSFGQKSTEDQNAGNPVYGADLNHSSDRIFHITENISFGDTRPLNGIINAGGEAVHSSGNYTTTSPSS
jgi:hypothetical protein